MEYSYTTLSPCGPTPVPSQCSIPPPPPSLSVETASLLVTLHQSVISICGVSLLSILLVPVHLLTSLPQYHQVCQYTVLCLIILDYHTSSSWWYTQCIVYKQVICTANNITTGNIYYSQSPVFNSSFVCSIMFCSTHTGCSVFDR